MPTESIKQRMAASHLGNMSKNELRKLLGAAHRDFNNIWNSLNNLTTDANNVQIVLNNLVSASGNMRVTVNNLVNDVVKLSNNLNSANNTVQITATAVVTNLNAATLLGGTALSTQQLVS